MTVFGVYNTFSKEASVSLFIYSYVPGPPGCVFLVTEVSNRVPIVSTIMSALLISFFRGVGSRILPLSQVICVF